MVQDAGLAGCTITGTVSYTPSAGTWTNSGVVATLTLTTTGTVTSSGWTPTGEGTIFTKTYFTNANETVLFQSPSGATGSVQVVISTIINSGSLGAVVNYEPAQIASGTITVRVTLSATGGTAPAHWTLSGTQTYVRVYTGSVMQQELTFSDIAGNTTDVLIDLTIDTTAPVATNVSYNPNTATNSPVVVTLTTNEPIQQPTNWN
ncbi:MAG: hypothetical protein LBP53_04180 [Candidatus Peribacteria bacterium]|jgi:hypothetical protein|nr:hypothetical protein [Candidatus Peribacteria bacterium]